MSTINTQEEAALHFINTKRSAIMAVQKVMHLPHPKAKKSECFSNTHNCIKTDKVVSGYVVFKKSTIQCDSGEHTGWAIMPHFWSVDGHSDIPLDRTPYDSNITKIQGKPKDWIYIVDMSLHDASYKLGNEDVSVSPIFSNIFIRADGKIQLVKKWADGFGATLVTVPDLEWLTLYEAYYSVGDN